MKMKLSDAIMTGSVLIKVWTMDSWCGCAIGMAAASLVGEQVTAQDAIDMAQQEWPFLEESIYPPPCMPQLSQISKFPVETIITFAFVDVCDGMMSLESLVDMVRDIESQFPEHSIEQPTTTAALEPVPVH